MTQRLINFIKYTKSRVQKTVQMSYCGLGSASDHYYLKKDISHLNTVLDLGACVGEFSRELSLMRPDASYILVEANPNLALKLHKLITPKNKKIINACIVGEKDRNKKNVLFNLTDNISSSTMNDDFAKNILIREKIRVPTITMEKIFNLCSIKKIDLLKIDIEGAEWGLLETFGKDEYERIKSITIEFHDFIDARFQTQTLNCIERLKLLGYKFISENNAYFGKYFNCLFYKQDE